MINFNVDLMEPIIITLDNKLTNYHLFIFEDILNKLIFSNIYIKI